MDDGWGFCTFKRKFLDDGRSVEDGGFFPENKWWFFYIHIGNSRVFILLLYTVLRAFI